MPCKMKVKNLYLEDYFINQDGSVHLIEFNSDVYCVFNTGAEAEKMKEILIRELAIPKEDIKIFMIE